MFHFIKGRMKILTNASVFITIVLCLLSCGEPVAKKKTETAGSYLLAWSDEFEYTGLPDSLKWDYATEGNEVGWGNDEVQHYTIAKKDNASIPYCCHSTATKDTC